MKTTILTAAMIILMTVANASAFNEPISSTGSSEKTFKVWVIQPDANIIKFRLNNPANEKIVIKIYNEKKVKVFHRTVKSEKEVSISCNMSNCGAGTFTCVVEKNGSEVVRKPITLN